MLWISPCLRAAQDEDRNAMAGWSVELVGACAAAVTTLCWVPQALRILRTRDTRAISLTTQAAFTGGIALWLVYGILIDSWPVILGNMVTLVIVSGILVLKLRYG
jgi:MtN3 and saliva related transmembrane protein